MYLSPDPLSVNGPPLRVQGDATGGWQAALREWKPLITLGLDSCSDGVTDCYKGEAGGRQGGPCAGDRPCLSRGCDGIAPSEGCVRTPCCSSTMKPSACHPLGAQRTAPTGWPLIPAGHGYWWVRSPFVNQKFKSSLLCILHTFLFWSWQRGGPLVWAPTLLRDHSGSPCHLPRPGPCISAVCPYKGWKTILPGEACPHPG